MTSTAKDITRAPITDNGQAIPVAEIGGRVTETTEKAEKADEDREKRLFVEDSLSSSVLSVHSVVSALSVLSVLSVSEDDGKAIAEAIESTVPTHESGYRRCLFTFGRWLKAISAIAEVGPVDLREVVKMWHQRARPVIPTKTFDDVWCDFLDGWPRIKWPRGSGPMSQILTRADSSELPTVAGRYDCCGTQRLIKLCRELQYTAGDGPFFLSVRTAGELVGLDRNSAWRRLRMLEADGIIRTVEAGTKTKATRYRYVAPLEMEPTP